MGLKFPPATRRISRRRGPISGALLNPLLDAISSTTYELGVKSIAMSVSTLPLTVGYDVSLYSTDVTNDIIPYNGGRYYQTAAKARRKGAEVGLTAQSTHGPFANAAFTFNDHKYSKYIVDSAVIDILKAGKTRQSQRKPSDGCSAHDVEHRDRHRGSRLSQPAHQGRDGAFRQVLRERCEHGERSRATRSSISPPSSEIRSSRQMAGVRADSSLVHNATNKKYIGSAFLNPDLVNGQPAAYEPGMPQTVIVSFSLGRIR